MPRRANTTMKRKRRKSRLMMDFMELMRDTTRFLRDAQYLFRNKHRTKATLVMIMPWQPTNQCPRRCC